MSRRSNASHRPISIDELDQMDLGQMMPHRILMSTDEAKKCQDVANKLGIDYKIIASEGEFYETISIKKNHVKKGYVFVQIGFQQRDLTRFWEEVNKL